MCVRYVHEKIICTEKICFIWDLHGSRPRLVTTNFVRPSGVAAGVAVTIDWTRNWSAPLLWC
jgi:hypothetical protein